MRKALALIGASAALVAGVAVGSTIASDSPTTVDAAAESGIEPASRLADYPGFGHDVAEDEAVFSAQSLEREQFISACMADAGFEYEPVPSIVMDASSEAAPTSGASLPGQGNADYYAALDDPQRQAYDLALAGTARPEEEYIEGAGCLGESARAVPNIFELRNSLLEEFTALRGEVAAHPSGERASREWSGCMAERGYDAADPSELAAELDADGAVIRAGVANDPIDLADDERAAGQAELECDQISGLAAVEAAVRVEVENWFYEEHRAVFDAYDALRRDPSGD